MSKYSSQKYNISQTVKRVVAKECGLKLKNISNGTGFMVNPGPDYYDCLGALYTLQHMFNVVLPEDKYGEYATVGGLTRDIVVQLKHRCK